MLGAWLAVGSLAVAGSGVRAVSANGVRMVVPSGWGRVKAASPGAVTDPRTLLVVGTAGVRPTGSNCQIAAYRVPVTGAVVVAVGWKNLALSGAEHKKPGRAPLNALVRVRRGVFECFAGPGAVALLVIAGKAYQVNVLVGVRASGRVVGAALAVARSFAVSQ